MDFKLQKLLLPKNMPDLFLSLTITCETNNITGMKRVNFRGMFVA
jgi:hypothetical protein